jgi:hypothetical protein
MIYIIFGRGNGFYSYFVKKEIIMISVKTVKSNGYNEVYILENGVVFLY